MEKENYKNGLIPSKKIDVMTIKKEYSIEELLQMSEIFYKSNLAPTHFKSKEAIFIGMKWAGAIGLDPFLGLKDIFVIDNIPNIKTEAGIALVEASGFCENIEQYFTGNEYDDDFTAVCIVKRKGRKEHVSKFSVKDAKVAKLWGKKTANNKDTAWVNYPRVMMMYRAVGFALRSIFPDALRGAVLREEIADYREVELTESKMGDDGLNITVQKKDNNSGTSNFNRATKVKSNLNDLPPSDDIEDVEEVK